MPKQKQVEVLGKAADETLRLQVKDAESKMDLAAGDDKVRQAQRVADMVCENPKAQIDFTSEHRSDQGDTRITVRSKAEPPRAVQAPQGSCFVATACFGDYDHPIVLELRKFRDGVLLKNGLGRGFVWFYYRFGPLMASGLNQLPFLKPPVQEGLRIVVRIIGRKDYLQGADPKE